LSAQAQIAYFSALALQGVSLILVAASGFLVPDREVFILVAFLFLVFICLSMYLMISRPDQVWYGARAIAESVKTMTWRFMCGAPPFRGEHSHASALFVERLLDTLRSNGLVTSRMPAPQASNSLTPAMISNRELALGQKIDLYKVHRIDEQLGWYSTKSRRARREGVFTYAVLVSLGVAGLVVCIFGVDLTDFSSAVMTLGLIAALCAFVMIWIQAKRYLEVAAAYALSAHEISIVAGKMGPPIGQYDFEEFVAEAENVFSREHTQWAARRDS
jgi:hypothetical protein